MISHKILEFPAPKARESVRTEVFRYGGIAIIVEVPASLHELAARAARLSGEPVERILASYAQRIGEDYGLSDGSGLLPVLNPPARHPE